MRTTYRDACIDSTDFSPAVKKMVAKKKERDTCKWAHYHVIRTPTARGRNGEMSLFKSWRLKCSLGSFSPPPPLPLTFSLRAVDFFFSTSNTLWRSLENNIMDRMLESKCERNIIFFLRLLIFLIRETFYCWNEYHQHSRLFFF